MIAVFRQCSPPAFDDQKSEILREESARLINSGCQFYDALSKNNRFVFNVGKRGDRLVLML